VRIGEREGARRAEQGEGGLRRESGTAGEEGRLERRDGEDARERRDAGEKGATWPSHTDTSSSVHSSTGLRCTDGLNWCSGKSIKQFWMLCVHVCP